MQGGAHHVGAHHVGAHHVGAHHVGAHHVEALQFLTGFLTTFGIYLLHS